MGNVSDLHFGSKASAKKKIYIYIYIYIYIQLTSEIHVFLLLQINYTMGVVSFAQNVLSTCWVPTGGVRCYQPHAPYPIKVRLLQYQ